MGQRFPPCYDRLERPSRGGSGRPRVGRVESSRRSCDPPSQRIIYGLTEDGLGPPDEFLTPIDLRFLRAGGAQLGSPGGWVAGTYERRWASTLAQCRRTSSLGATFILLVHDLYGADGTPIGRWPGDDGSWEDFERFLDRLIDDVHAAGIHVQWDLWNEPDLGMFWGCQQQQYLDAWLAAYRRVRGAVPDAVIVGPSTATEPAEDDPWWNAYLDFAAANDAVPDVISWHEIGGKAHGQDAVASREALEAMLARRGLKGHSFQVNEYAEPAQQNPGQSAWFIARLERAKVDGLRANWGSGQELHDNLAGLLSHGSAGYRPLADWHTYRAYASQRGTIVATEPGVAVDAFATLEDDGAVQVLVGNHGGLTGSVNIKVRAISNLPGLRDGRILVRVDRISFADGAPSQGTDRLGEEFVDAGPADEVTVSIDVRSDKDAHLVRMQPVGELPAS